MDAKHPGSEVQALMIASDSDCDVTEFGAPEKKKRRRQNNSSVDAAVTCLQNKCSCLPLGSRAGSFALIVSVLINIVLLTVVIAVHSKAALSLPSQANPAANSPSAKISDRPSSREPSPSAGPWSLSNVTGCGVTCGTGTESLHAPVDAGYVNVFRDLSGQEIKATVQFLLRQPELAVSLDNRRDNWIFSIEVYVPSKSSALSYLDSTGPQPPRRALVSLAMGSHIPPVFRQYVVGPLPSPTYYAVNPRMAKDVPLSRMTRYRFVEAYRLLQQSIRQRDVSRILQESFGTRLCTSLTTDTCVTFLGQKISFGLMNTTSFCFSAYYQAEIATIHPLPFQLVISEVASGGQLAIRWVNYAGASFLSLGELITGYDSGTIVKMTRRFPANVPGESSTAGSMNLRGKPSPATPHPPPRQYEPKGSRFSIVNQHVKYLEWSFDVRNSIESSLQLYNIKWSGERIVYELSLQEIIVLYAGANPSSMFAHLSDSAFGLGDNAKGLVPGVDCPHHAQFLSTWAYNHRDSRLHAERLPNTVCVFEHNSGVPLRRHRVPSRPTAYGALVDNYLVVRTIIVEFNYDYIVDVVFHANGALETRVYATGYIMSQWFHYGEAPFGFKVSDDIVGSIHHHLFNFKVDMDVGGVSNRYETLDFTVDSRSWPWLSILNPSATSSASSSSSFFSTSEKKFQQIAFKHHIRKTEKDALYNYNFDKPKYHIFYNDKQKNRFGNVRAYRLVGRGFSKQLLPEEHPAVRSRKWMQYCMAVTQRKESEAKSSSIFSMYDADDPVVDFENFHRDDEDIVDKDLVAWVTVGMHHIPHTEDIPNTPTVGTEAAILLMPYNYFPECPSARSRDAVRLQGTRDGPTRVQTYGTQTEFTCLPPVYSLGQQSRSSSSTPVK